MGGYLRSFVVWFKVGLQCRDQSGIVKLLIL